MRLSVKIAICILAIVLISGIFSVLAIIYFQRQISTHDFEEFGVVLANTVYDDLRADMIDHKPEHIQLMLESLNKNQMINEVVIHSWKLDVAFSPLKQEVDKKARDKDVLEVLESGKRKQRMKTNYGKKEYCVLIPIKNEKACYSCHTSDPSLLGVIEIGIGMEQLSRHLERDTRVLTTLLVITSVLILLSVLLFLQRVVLKRLSVIVNTIKRFSQGDYSKRIEIKSRDELGALASTFNTMADEVQKTFAKLKEADEEFDRSLIRFGRLLASTLDLEKIPNLIINELTASIKCSEVCMLIRSNDDKLILVGAKGIALATVEKYNSKPDICQKMSSRFAALWSSKYLYVDEDLSINRTPGKKLFSKIAGLHKGKDFYLFPLQGAENMVGLLTIVAPPGTCLAEDKIKMVCLICQETATAIENFATHQFLKKASITDELTQLYNQRHFFNTLKEEVDRAERYGRVFSLLFLDLDRFKLFNDSYGHRVGDKILHKVGQLIKRLTRSSDKVFRYGGDEYALILPETDGDKAEKLANRIREEIESTNFVPIGHEVDLSLSASVGIVIYDHGRFEGEDDIFKAVDDALREAKKTCRNKVVVG